MTALLEVRDLHLRFGGVKAVDGLSFDVREGEILAVIGPNGAGKTSAFNCISGFYRPTSGSIAFEGRSIMRVLPSTITRRGMARTFQNLRLFKEMTVLDNVKTAMHANLREGFFDTLLHTPRYRRAEAACAREARGWLDFVGFEGDEQLYVTQLPYGEQRRVEIARALATSPKLLLLDEPAAGLNYGEKQGLIRLIRKIRDLGVGTSHFDAQAWRQGRAGLPKRLPMKAVLVQGSTYKTSLLRRRLIAEGLKEPRCEQCGLSEWRGEAVRGHVKVPAYGQRKSPR